MLEQTQAFHRVKRVKLSVKVVDACVSQVTHQMK